MAGKIFINYRRGDDPAAAGRLFDRLQDVFEPEQLFLDVDNIAPGLDFVHVLNDRVAECDIVLAIIGKGWIDARDAVGGRRLEDPDDFVRIEISSALSQGKRVIPVLVGDAPMPRPEELPESLRPLTRRNAVRLTHERFRADTQGLIKALQQALMDIDALRQAEAKSRAEELDQQQRRFQEAEAARRAAEEENGRRFEAEAREREAEEQRGKEEEATRRAEEERSQREAEAARRAEEEERKRLAEIEAQERATEERRRRGEVAQQAENERRRQKAEGARRSEDDRKKLAEIEGRQRAAEELRRDKATAKTRAGEERAVRIARRAGTGTIVIAATLAVLLIAGAVVWLEMRPSAGSQSPSAAANPSLTASSFTPAAVNQETNRTGLTIKAKIASETPAALPPGASVMAPVPAASPGSSPGEVAWLPLQDSTDEAALNRFVTQFPNSPRRADAEARMAALAAMEAAWNLVKDSAHPDELQRFVQAFPNSTHRTDAEQRIASLAAESAKASSVNPPNAYGLARSLQLELQRVGCFNGAVNGEFDGPTRAAQRIFAKLTSISLPDALSPEAIDAVRKFDKRVCPLVCPEGQRAEGEQCISVVPQKPQQRKTERSKQAPRQKASLVRPPAQQAIAPAAQPGPGRGLGPRYIVMKNGTLCHVYRGHPKSSCQ